MVYEKRLGKACVWGGVGAGGHAACAWTLSWYLFFSSAQVTCWPAFSPAHQRILLAVDVMGVHTVAGDCDLPSLTSLAPPRAPAPPPARSHHFEN